MSATRLPGVDGMDAIVKPPWMGLRRPANRVAEIPTLNLMTLLPLPPPRL
ncbi:MAG: hypothetical protein HQL48_04515 [Gammaproteobacteria bacterium]|nr:hypothetical protein [Gammaproteobacteria bacterium]